MEDLGPPGGREVQPDGTGLSQFYGCGKVGAGGGGRSQWDVRGGAAGVIGGAVSTGRRAACWSAPTFPPLADFIASAGTA